MCEDFCTMYDWSWRLRSTGSCLHGNKQQLSRIACRQSRNHSGSVVNKRAVAFPCQVLTRHLGRSTCVHCSLVFSVWQGTENMENTNIWSKCMGMLLPANIRYCLWIIMSILCMCNWLIYHSFITSRCKMYRENVVQPLNNVEGPSWPICTAKNSKNTPFVFWL